MNTAKYKPVDPNKIYMFDINQSVVYQQEQQDSYNKTLEGFRNLLKKAVDEIKTDTYDFNEVANDNYKTPPSTDDDNYY